MGGVNQQLLDEAEYDQKQKQKLWRSRRVLYAEGGQAEADNTLQDLHNSSDHTKAEFKFNNYFINYSK